MAVASQEEDDGDLEMGVGGGSSMLVAERVRMIQEPSATASEAAAAEEPPARPEPEVRGPSIAERRAMLEKKRTPPPPIARKNSASAEKLRRSRTAPSCGYCGLDVFVSEAQRSRGKVFHAACLRCGLCAKALVACQWGQLDTDDDMMYCDERVDSCLRRLKTRHLDHAKESANQRLSEEDATMTAKAKTRAVSVIGDELENIVAQLAPRCALCGGLFGGADRLVMQGMVKMHEACMRGQAPTGSGAEPTLTPKRAIADAPASLLVKLAPSRGRVVTFFLAKRAESPEERIALFDPDPKSRAPHTRKVDLAAVDGAGARCISVSGGELAPATTAVLDGARLVAAFAWEGSGLRWALEAAFRVDGGASTLTLEGASLRVEEEAPTTAALV